MGMFIVNKIGIGENRKQYVSLLEFGISRSSNRDFKWVYDDEFYFT